MTIDIDFPVLLRMYGGYQDPALPEGVWFAAGSVTGDGSGGARRALCIFSAANIPDSRWFSLNDLSVLDTDNNAKAGTLLGSNLEIGRKGSGGLTFVDATMVVGESLGQLSAAAQRNIAAGQFIGRKQALGTDAEIIVAYPNVDGAVLSFQIGGYYWGPRSNIAPGGPSRPVQGFYES